MSTPSEKRQPVRGSGLLLHPTSLPGPFGIGDLGPAAYAWIDALRRARQRWWQLLPLGPTGFGDSPYQSFSSFAGNPYLISPELLIQDGLLTADDLAGTGFPGDRVDYGRVIDFKLRMLSRAWEHFRAGTAPDLQPLFEAFCEGQAAWLDDFALFMALKDAQGGKSWLDWPEELLLRKRPALERARRELRGAVQLQCFRQFLFFRQWETVRRYAHDHGIQIIGDVPIFVSSDSADVWANPDLFMLDEERRPTVVAGVPPDYFSSTGQLWGNPLYNWDALKQTDYAWWVARMRATLQRVDIVRLDHFRGFEAYWEVPAGMPTAEHGQWVKGPGADLFRSLQRQLGDLPLLAEDLGLITPEVEALREQFQFPGMRVLQFAFGGAVEHRFLPHNYDRNTVVYTGTHDNDTTCGWYASISEHERHFLRRYVPYADQEVAWALIRLAWASVADYALAPVQDVLSLGNEGRMNLPGSASSNWSWRLAPGQLHDGVLDRLADITDVYGRAPR